MFIYNLKIILRNLFRFKISFITNFIGLSAGLATVITIYLWVNDELMVDRFHEHGDLIFQVMEHQHQDGTLNTSGNTADYLAQSLQEEFPEIERSAVVTPPKFFLSFNVSVPDRHVKGIGKFVSKDFFNIFSFPLLLGNAGRVLENRTNVVLSESLAKKLFTTSESSMGKTLEWETMGIKREVIVSGVYLDLPASASEKFDFIVTFDSFKELMGMKDGDVNWNQSGPFYTYLLLKKGTDVTRFNVKIEKLLKQKSKTNLHRTLFVKPYADSYLYGQYENGKEAGGRIEYVILFSTIAVFIVVIACINFMNLSTAQAFKKIRETGVRRIIGAQQKTLVLQNLQEVFVITFLSLLFAIVVVKLVLPQFNVLAGKNLDLVLDSKTIVAVLSMLILTALAAGGYPSWYLSRFNPAKALKGQFSTSLNELWARRGLVVFQFSLSVIFIVFVFVVYKQIEFIQEKNLGYDKENVLYFEAEGKTSANPEPIITEIKDISGVSDASSMLGGIITQTNATGIPGMVEYNGKKVTMNNSAVNYGMMELLGLQMKEGRTFSRDFPSDAKKIIFNEAAVEALGIENPVGKNIDGREVLGVVKNFHYESLHEPVKPYCFRMENSTSVIMVKIQDRAGKQVIHDLEKIYKSHNPGHEFNYSFLDNDYQKQYASEKRVSTLAQYATGLAILISCLGLFGIVTFTTEKREKEIGIRKVLGSSEFAVIRLLSNEFIGLITVAVIIALPISYLIVNKWLDGYTYKVELAWWYFAGAACITMAISWLTVVSQTIRAAKANPTSILKSE